MVVERIATLSHRELRCDKALGPVAMEDALRDISALCGSPVAWTLCVSSEMSGFGLRIVNLFGQTHVAVDPNLGAVEWRVLAVAPNGCLVECVSNGGS